MTDLLTLLDEYLATRRALGAGLVEAERLLRGFLAFLAQHEATRMTTQLALQWATSQVQSARHAQRLGIVRGFARYAHVADPRHEAPPEGLLKSRDRRATPYIYSDKEIADLIAAARRLRRQIQCLMRTGVEACLGVRGAREMASGSRVGGACEHATAHPGALARSQGAARAGVGTPTAGPQGRTGV